MIAFFPLMRLLLEEWPGLRAIALNDGDAREALGMICLFVPFFVITDLIFLPFRLLFAAALAIATLAIHRDITREKQARRIAALEREVGLRE